LSGSAAGNYVLNTSTASTTAKINLRPVTPSVTASNKTYDGSSLATITACTLSNKIAGEDVTCSVGSASFASANGGTWTVTASGISLTGAGSGNYVLTASTAVTMATIFPAPQTITFGPLADKVYGNPPFAVSATASSGLPVAFAVSTPGSWQCT